MNDYYNKYIKYKTKYFRLKDNNIHSTIDIPIKFKKIMFPYKKNIDYIKLKVNKESLYSSSKTYGASFIINIIKSYFHNNDLRNIVITDGTSNIGTDAISLALHFNYVNAIELNKENCNILQHNVKQYNLNNIKVYCQDFLQIINNVNQDVIYVDPPWGGKSYKEQDKINLYLSDIEIADVVLSHINKTKLFVVKVPNNFDFDSFFTKVNKNKSQIYSYKKKDGTVSFHIIVVVN